MKEAYETSPDYDLGKDDAINHMGYCPPDESDIRARYDYDEGYAVGVAYLKLEEKKYEDDS